MKIENDVLKLIKDFSDDSTDTHAKAGLGTAYWSMLISSICDTVIEKRDLGELLAVESSFINVGAFPKISGDKDAANSAIFNTDKKFDHLDIISVTDLLQIILKKINSGEKKESVERKIKSSQVKKDRLVKGLSGLELKRTDLLKASFGSADVSTLKIISELPHVDTLVFENLRVKKAIASGLFMNVENKRAFVAKTRVLDERLLTLENLYKSISDTKTRVVMREILRNIETVRNEIINFEERIDRHEKELKKIELESQNVSEMEVESGFRTELEFLRDNVKLASRRLKQDNCSFFNPEDNHVTLSELQDAMDIILEFDPKIFHNSRIPIYGRPKLLLVPGNGSGIYDWKNNLFVIPQTTHFKDIMPSLAAAVMEYRLDTDEDKLLINSYQKLSTQKDIKSIITLKENLTRDYIKWLTSEYNGFKVLDKETRAWFEYYVGPSKKSIFTPPELQPFLFSSNQIKDLFSENEKLVSDGTSEEIAKSSWILSVLEFQNGNYQKAYDYIIAAKDNGFTHKFLSYNVSFICSKAARKPEAIEAIKVFITENTQGWWAALARDNQRSLG